jgi:putative YhdH/YhfP family quinone oxidoreductase
MSFKALRITETPTGKFERKIVEREIDDLPAGEVLIKVCYSSLNYKDALSATGHKGVTKRFPHTPGIDAAGVVEISRNAYFATGEEVIITGYDLGMNTDGGHAEYIRVPGQWIIPRPTDYTMKECMIIGTAGFTAASALYKMQLLGQSPSDGQIVVTGATGGVGSMAVAILSKAGYEVIAVTGKTQVTEYLHHLGAAKIESREFVKDNSGKAVLKAKWSGAIDTVGGATLGTLVKACKSEGTIVTTGLVDSPKLDGTLYPFILNGVNLAGIGSADTPMQRRMAIWEKLTDEWNIKDKLPVIAKEVTLDEVNNTYIDSILQGKMIGRVIVKL